ncbi:uncharacterized protein LOC111026551 isoform X2 [Myzus persicae]|uniref:uncharacterized protein LOC111026551 isoform X2 n=1 Tax=Myzus persicae TaxID=13164 RepID=UPI000B938DDE|nr:uncharacterized protein LOC111026551 isoform X2 [Myzus persicae]
MLSELISVNNGLYRIAVGKYTKDIKVIDSEFTKIINVEMIYLNEHHTPLTLSYAEHIAIIILQNRVYFNDVVAPVCIDWNGEYNVVKGDQGKVKVLMKEIVERD